MPSYWFGYISFELRVPPSILFRSLIAPQLLLPLRHCIDCNIESKRNGNESPSDSFCIAKWSRKLLTSRPESAHRAHREQTGHVLSPRLKPNPRLLTSLRRWQLVTYKPVGVHLNYTAARQGVTRQKLSRSHPRTSQHTSMPAPQLAWHCPTSHLPPSPSRPPQAPFDIAIIKHPRSRRWTRPRAGRCSPRIWLFCISNSQ